MKLSRNDTHYFVIQCIWDRTADHSYTLFVAVVLVMAPLLTMLMAYIQMLVKIYRTKSELGKFADKEGQRPSW